jgi:ArsR family transcriptional regulator
MEHTLTSPDQHAGTTLEQLEEASLMFKALADRARLATLVRLARQECSVGELARLEGDKVGTVSARLQVLLQARLVTRRKDGKSTIYAIADAHVLNMINNAIDHACESHHPPRTSP